MIDLRQLKFVGAVFSVGLALAAVYSVVGPRAHTFALHGSTVISTGTWTAAGAQIGNSLPASVDTPAEFKDFIGKMLYSTSAYGIPGSSYNMYGAAFLVETMLNGQINYAASDAVALQARADYDRWASYIDQYAARGAIQWSVSTTVPAGRINSLHVCNEGAGGYCWDRAVYQNNNYNGGGWDARRFQFYTLSSPDPSTLIIFTNPNGTTFQIRRECANVIGSAAPLSPGWQMSGHTDVDYGERLPGESLRFFHYVQNDGPTNTGRDIWWAPLEHPSNAYMAPGQNSGQYTAGQEKYVGESDVDIPIDTPPGTEICHKVLFDWKDSGGGRNGTGEPACATVRSPDTTCGGLVINPSILGSNDSYTITGTINTEMGMPGAQIIDNNGNFFITVSGPSVSINNTNVTPVTVGGSASTAGTGTLTAGISAPPTNNVGTYTVTYGVSGGGVDPVTCNGSFTVALRPYFSVLGGDISAGAGFGDTSCPGSSAIIKSWNLNTTTAPNYYGAGGEAGVWATGAITNFVSALGLTGGAASTGGYGLSFANTSNTSGGGYGGNFGVGSVPCMYDYYGSKPTPNPPSIGGTTIGTFATTNSGVYQAPVDGLGAFTLGGSGDITLGAGKQITIYLSGNLYIKNNILYNYATIADIPRLNVYVSGNIYIDPNVTEIHGVYVAQKTPAGTNGIVNTCNPGTVTSPQPYATCNRQLRVVGSMISQAAIRLTRTYGNLTTVTGATNQPAEIFQYSPEMWMAAPAGNGFEYQSYTSLPPVL